MCISHIIYLKSFYNIRSSIQSKHIKNHIRILKFYSIKDMFEKDKITLMLEGTFKR